MANKIIDLSPKKKGCTKCNPVNKLKQFPTSVIIFSLSFFGLSVYGVIQLVKTIISLF